MPRLRHRVRGIGCTVQASFNGIYRRRHFAAGSYGLGGQPMERVASLQALWEYIRIYMEEGPNAVPRPARLRSTFPWP